MINEGQWGVGQASGIGDPSRYIVLRPEGAQGAERRCFFFPKFFLWADRNERKKLGGNFAAKITYKYYGYEGKTNSTK